VNGVAEELDLAGLRRALEAFAAESARIFLDISQRFPALEKKINDEIDEATAVINHFFWNLEPGADQGLAGSIEKHKHSLLAVNEAMGGLLAKDQELLAALFACIQETRGIETHLAHIRGLAKDVKVHAINSIVVSAKSGQAGEGYRALSKFFILFSNRARLQIEDLAGSSRRFFAQFDAYELEVKSLAAEDAALLEHTGSTFRATFQRLLESFHAFSVTLHDLFDRVGQNRVSIRSLINRMQEQDIVQQQLQHVVQIFDQFARERDAMEPAEAHGMEAALCELGRLQLQSIRAAVADLTESTEAILTGMLENLTLFSEDRALITSYMARDQGITDSKAAIDRLLDRAIEFLGETVVRFDGSLARKRRAGAASAELGGALGELEPHFHRLSESTEVFSHMNFMAKKEVAQHDVFRRAGTSLSGDVMDTLSTRMKGVLVKAEADYSASRADLARQLKSFIGRIAVQELAFKDVVTQTLEAKATLDHTRDVLKESLLNVSNFATDLQREVDDALRGMQGLGGVTRDLAVLEKSLTEAREASETRKRRLPQGGAFRVTGARIEPYLRCYSVAKEREIARGLFPDLPEDTGAKSGKVELF